MVFGIIIVVVAIVVAVLLNKSKISKVASQVEEAIAPAIEEAKAVVAKAEKIAPKNGVIKTAAKQAKAVKTTTKKQK
jgi:Sec-independent protein translocase protein TatA